MFGSSNQFNPPPEAGTHFPPGQLDEISLRRQLRCAS